MDSVIVYVDDATYAQQQLASMRNADASVGKGIHWILVACAPRMTRHTSKWVNNSGRENWRTKWAEKLFAQIVPHLEGHGDRVSKVVSKGPLAALTKELLSDHGVAHVLDARRPKFGQELQAVKDGQSTTTDKRWTAPGAVADM